MTDRTPGRTPTRRTPAAPVAGQRRRVARELPVRRTAPVSAAGTSAATVTAERPSPAVADQTLVVTGPRAAQPAEPAYDDAAVTRTAPASRRERLARLNVVLAPLALAAVVAAGFAWRTDTARAAVARHRSAAVAAARVNALVAARSAAADVLSYDYRHFDADVTKGAAHLTGDQRSQYLTLMASTVKPTALQVHAAVKAVVSDAAVVDAAPTTAEVLAFVDQTSSNTKRPAPQLSQDRVLLHLALVDGRWLVTKFDAI